MSRDEVGSGCWNIANNNSCSWPQGIAEVPLGAWSTVFQILMENDD